MLGEALRLIRVFHDLKQSELAERLEISQSHLSDIERCRKVPSQEIVSRYAKESAQSGSLMKSCQKARHKARSTRRAAWLPTKSSIFCA